MSRPLRTRLLPAALTLAALLGASGPAWAQAVTWRSHTLFGGRRALDGGLVMPVQQYVLAEAGGPRDTVAARLDMRAAADTVDPSTAGLRIYELLLRHGGPGDRIEAVVGRQVLLTGSGAWLVDGASATVRTPWPADVVVAGGIERHSEVAADGLGPHLVMAAARLRDVPATALQAAWLLRDDRAGRREHRLGLTGRRAPAAPLSPSVDVAVELEATSPRWTLAEGVVAAHPGPGLLVSLAASRSEPLPHGPVLGDGLWELFMAGPTERLRARGAWSGSAGALAGSWSGYRLRPHLEETALAQTLRLVWSGPWWGTLRPSAGAFGLTGGAGRALGGRAGVAAQLGITELSVRADVAWYEQVSGLAGLAAWLRVAAGRSLTRHLHLRAVAEGGRGADLRQDLRALLTLSAHFRGVRP